MAVMSSPKTMVRLDSGRCERRSLADKSSANDSPATCVNNSYFSTSRKKVKILVDVIMTSVETLPLALYLDAAGNE